MNLKKLNKNRREKVEEVEQYDNVNSDSEEQEHGIETTGISSKTESKVSENEDRGTGTFADFDTPSARIMRAIRELDCMFFVACLQSCPNYYVFGISVHVAVPLYQLSRNVSNNQL